MSYTIKVVYTDEFGCDKSIVLLSHPDYNQQYLQYDDLMREPIEVRSIVRYGLVINKTMSDGSIIRSGTLIPVHRIKSIQWDDTLIEDEEKRNV